MSDKYEKQKFQGSISVSGHKSKYAEKLKNRRAWANQVGKNGWTTNAHGSKLPKPQACFVDVQS